jgi:pimeloyl-ACP methyl ester carboxylesterase
VQKIKQVLALFLLAVLMLTWMPSRSDAAAALVPAPAGAAQSSRYPVIFIPGIGGTELNDKGNLVWINSYRLMASQLPILSLFQMDWLLPLRFKADGTTPYYGGHDIRTGDLMRHGQTDIYSGLLNELKAEGYVEGKDLFLFPYDWRADIGASAAALGRQVDQVLARTGARQVVLIGHSMGGLVARDYVVSGGAAKVKATIALATPWLGTPMAYRALEYGWDMGLKLPGTKWSALGPKDVKLLAQNYPSVYELAPARQYFDWYPDGYLTRFGQNLSFDQAVSLGLGPHNPALAQRVPALYSQLLDGSNHGVQQYIVAGTGSQTLAGITERKDWLGMTHKAERYTDGDEIVPLASADLGYSRDQAAASRYIGKLAGVAYAAQPHTQFTQSPEVQASLRTWLTQINRQAAAAVAGR